jgi:hypothetical protein
MTEADYSPDWGAWQLMSAVTIEAAVALSLAVNPDLLWDWKRQATRDEIKEFQRRLQWAERWPLRGPNSVAVGYLGGTRSVHLVEFVQYAEKAGWNLPEQLRTSIPQGEKSRRRVQSDRPSEANRVTGTAETEGAKTAIEMYKSEEAAADRTPERPPGVSDNAWDNFLDARKLDPDFAKTHGGQSKVARKLAKTDTTKEEATVRRDLQRVLKAIREANEQK